MGLATRNGVLAAAASGVMALALPVSSALAADGAGADAAAGGSPGLLSGNAIQVPVEVPVNICGNTVDVAGLLNPAAGNSCANKNGAKTGSSRGGNGSAASSGSSQENGGEAASSGASAQSHTADSPGLLSGNGLQLPVDLPVNVSGNSVSVVGLGNPVFGNESVNGRDDQARPTPNTPAPKPAAPERAVPGNPAPETPVHAWTQPGSESAAPVLAHTGADLTVGAVAGSAALLIAGGVLYRRFRPDPTR
ncbi:chaplin [Streptomyces sp. NBC_01723]|uniref:chaplin n=1 Tax=Streptomyces sp. NBC_01723 TaxID=2975921 RepID=UPI002E2EC2AF|nr:chaplin [Streptomyces sp. NBC_01723]